DGFPFGSVVPYCLDHEGAPIFLISTIAEHTKNLTADSRCSLTILRESDDVQSNGRICLIGHVERLSDDVETLAEKYYRHFPKSRQYHGAHNFSFYRMKYTAIRYIGGFGQIHWLEPQEFYLTNPFHGKNEAYIVNHMNEDHQADLKLYCEHYKQMTIKEENIRMAGVDTNGFDVFVGDKKVRFAFDSPIQNTKEARERLVALSKAAKR
ncbi:MAG: DUF2470 domain-containing protein, partial [Bacteroidota bacterium]